MQFKLATLATVALATLATATPVRRTGIPASQCSTGPVQCCNSVQPASSSAVSAIFALLGIVIQDLNIDVGLTCSPISVIGLGSNSCTAQAVCCEDNSFKGLVAIGCTPVDLSL
ncbi:fungal hydrophobin-domain-containing protein [Crucibulum laeve]|uniref:Hydrophobin n=1 Tax=Crucibulum laeve TaxID=68775 RepID=A0A5C3MEG8_9AGAR|nr:fungal hydrophobin-domain-containing protein [Crucibulum laeve]